MNPTPEQVAQWAREAGFHAWYSDPDRDYHFACATKLVTRAMAEQAEADAVICDELAQHYSDYKDTALLNGDIELSNAASGEPRAAEAIASLIRYHAPKVTT